MGKWSPEWEIVLLGEIAEFRNGINYGSANRGRGIKVVGVADFQNRVYVPYDELSEIDPTGVVRDEDLLRENDFVFVRSNGNRELIGRSLFVRDLPGAVTHSGFTIRLRFVSDQVAPEFFAQIFRSEITRDEISNQGSGTNISNLSQQILGTLSVPLPPLPEQRKIAAILSTWDDAISLTSSLIEALQWRKRALMRLLLTGEVRFKEFEGAAWDSAQLAEVFERVERKVTANSERVLSITATVGFVDQGEKFGRVIAGKNLEHYIRLMRGEFAYNKGNSKAYPQGCIYRLDEYDEGAVPNVYYCFRTNSPEAYNDFYKHYFESGALNNQLRPLINSGVRNDGLLNLSADSFFEIEVVVPPYREQERIAAVLNCVAKEIHLTLQMLDQLRAQKSGLMQQLLTGAVRVQPEIE